MSDIFGGMFDEFSVAYVEMLEAKSRLWKRSSKKWWRQALSWQAWGEAHQADANRRLEFMQYVEKHKKVCMFCYTRYHTDDCKWAKELADAK